MWFYRLLNVGFFFFHSSLILFNLFGWAWRKTRLWNLVTLSAVAFSWFGLGIWYGWGYCPCTQWHWEVRQKLGYTDMPASYIQFLVEKFTGLHFQAAVVDAVTVVLFFIALGISLFLNLRDWRNRSVTR